MSLDLAKVVDIDYMTVVRRVISAIVEGIAVIVVALYLSKKQSIPISKKDIMDAVILGVVAASVFTILDLISAPVASAARKGAGFVIGSNLAGGF